MRGIVWFVLLFVVAVVAATTLGRNDGLVSIYRWRSCWPRATAVRTAPPSAR